MGRETNKSRREAQAQSAREKAAAARSQAKQADQRRRAMVILSSVVVVAIVGGIIAFIAINSGGKNKAVVSNSAAVATVMNKVASVPAAALDTVGKGSIIAVPKKITGTTLTKNGLPQLLYIGAEFCPYCAGERWAMAVALSKFGTLHGTSFTASSGTDSDPNTSTLDFKNATYTSKYLDFAPVEAEDRNRNPLETPTSAQGALWAQYSGGASKEGFPFLDFGNQYLISGPSFLPDKLANLSQTQIANQLSDPTTDVSKGILGGANLITATICNMTNNQPSTVCSSSTVKSMQALITSGQDASSSSGSSS